MSSICDTGDRNDELLLAEDRSQPADFGAESGPDVLRRVRHQVLDRFHDLVEQGRSVHERAKSGDLARNGGPELGLVVLEQVDKGLDQIPLDNLFIDGVCNLSRR